ncbi:hypothetical protein [Algoriphagus sp. C2-6-M1]|nr:hypothetical protein [Algoriphagus sp. C2-6-M1]
MTIFTLVGLVILHFIVGIGYVIYKISGGTSPKKDKVKSGE